MLRNFWKLNVINAKRSDTYILLTREKRLVAKNVFNIITENNTNMIALTGELYIKRTKTMLLIETNSKLEKLKLYYHFKVFIF